MPSFRVHTAYLSADLDATRAECDGCDPRRPCEEHCDRSSLWFVTAGAMEVRDRSGVRVIDPTLAIAMPAHHPFVVRHPAGPDTCIGIHGPLVDELAAGGPHLVPITPAIAARITAELVAWRAGYADDFALPELLASLVPDERAVVSSDLAGAVARAMRLSFASHTSLGELAQTTGYSVFHTCRVFQRTTGQTIHGFRRELRLRHALARLLDGDEPLAEIAAATGFASQSHLTNLFRARFGLTPGKARTRDGQRLLSSV